MAGSDSSSTQSQNRSYSSSDGRGSTFDRNVQSLIKSRGSFSLEQPDESKNTKYKYFQKIGMRRPEAIAKNSVALNNDWNNTAYSAIHRDGSFS